MSLYRKLTDEELVLLLNESNQDAFAELYEQNLDTINEPLADHRLSWKQDVWKGRLQRHSAVSIISPNGILTLTTRWLSWSISAIFCLKRISGSVRVPKSYWICLRLSSTYCRFKSVLYCACRKPLFLFRKE